LTCSYKEQEFFRCGYYVNNFYENEEWNITPPEKIQLNNLKRHILFDKPRITKFNISWDQPVVNVSTYNNFMFDESFHNNNIQNEFKNIDYNNYNKNCDVNAFQNAFKQNTKIPEEDNSHQIFQEIINGSKQN